MRPAAVVREHPIGFQHVTVLAAIDHVAVFEHFIEVGAQALHGRCQARHLLLNVLGDEIGHDHTRLVQHHVSERYAFAQRRAFEMDRTPGGRLGAGQCQCGQLARGDHFRQHHRGGLQCLDFFLGIGAACAILHDQHAKRVAGAQDRHAKE